MEKDPREISVHPEPYQFERPPVDVSMTSRLSLSPGMLWIISACVVFSLTTMAVHAAGSRGIPSGEILLIRCITQVALSAGTCAYLHKNPLGPAGHRTLPVLRGIFGSLSAGSMYYGATHIAVSDATGIMFSSPIWTPFIAYMFMGEPIRRLHLTAVLVGFVGVLLVVQPEILTRSFHQLWTLAQDPEIQKDMERLIGPDRALPGTPGYTFAALVCLFGSCCSATAYVVIRKTEESGIYFQVLVFYFGALGIVTALVQMIFIQGVVLPEDIITWFYLFCVCILGYAGQTALNKGAQMIPASQTALLRNLDVALVVLWQILFLHQVPTLWSVLGICCICSCTVLMAFSREKGLPPK